MNNAKYCESCGNTVLPEYQFCPYCGESLTNKDKKESLEDVLAEPFSRMEKIQAEDFLKRLEKLSYVLSELENEINAIISAKK